MSDIYNARIERAEIRIDREVFLCAWLHMRFGESESSGQGFGGSVLFNTAQKEKRQDDNAFAARYITGIMETLEVENWANLTGKYCRIEIARFNDPIAAVGHITKDKWFRPKELADICFPQAVPA